MRTLTLGFPAKFQLNALFAMSLLDSMDKLRTESGYTVKTKYLLGKSNLSHARSIMVTEWYDNAKTDDLFMFIDTDQTFTADDILRVISQKGDLRAGIYANRAQNATSIAADGETFSASENTPLAYAATGFLCFTYEATKLIHEYIKNKEHIDRVIISDDIPIENNCIPFFNPIIGNVNNNGKTYWLGEDFSFSLRARRAGLKIVGAIIHTLGHEMPFVVYYNKSLKKDPITWEKDSIVYYCGNSRVRFSPEDTSLGGSEQAVVNLSKAFAERGKHVTVYGNVKPGFYDGVRYVRVEEFNVKDKFDKIILWRRFGLEALPPLEYAKAVYIDLHDPTDPQAMPKLLVENKVNKIFVKSQFHMSFYTDLEKGKFTVIPNGIQTEFITDLSPKPDRIKHRFCYTSCYERGLIPILKYLWPLLKTKIPEAEFHIHYGSELVSDSTRALLNELFKQPGVYEHGRSPYKTTLEERYKCLAQIYITDVPQEIDCLSVREAALAGCIPIMSEKGVFSERAGLHIEGDPKSKTVLEDTAELIYKVYSLPDAQLDKYREAIQKNALKQTWSETADNWLSNM